MSREKKSQPDDGLAQPFSRWDKLAALGLVLGAAGLILLAGVGAAVIILLIGKGFGYE